MHTPLYVLGVGSGADILFPEYRDIDLLICPEQPALRSNFVTEAYKRIKPDPNFLVERHSPKGSAPILNAHDEPYADYKLVTLPVGSIETAQYVKLFDITFVGENGGTFAGVLQFHRSNNLAFTQLTI